MVESFALSRARRLAACLVLAGMVCQLGAIECGCWEHNGWTLWLQTALAAPDAGHAPHGDAEEDGGRAAALGASDCPCQGQTLCMLAAPLRKAAIDVGKSPALQATPAALAGDAWGRLGDGACFERLETAKPLSKAPLRALLQVFLI